GQLERVPRNEMLMIVVVHDSATSRNYVSGLLKRHKYQVLDQGVRVVEIAELR
ncbi:diguanylate cyclase response regulator, partial [Pseudoalteromonas ruthenica]